MPHIDPMTEDPREDKLPVWAKTLLKDMRRRTGDAEQKAEQTRLATDPATSDALLDYYDDHPIGLGKHARVRFVLERGHDDDVRRYVDVEIEHDGKGKPWVQVRGDSILSLKSYASNVYWLDTDRS